MFKDPKRKHSTCYELSKLIMDSSPTLGDGNILKIHKEMTNTEEVRDDHSSFLILPLPTGFTL